MKICWDNLENLRLTKNGNLRNYDKKRSYIFRDSCKVCGEEFLSKARKEGIDNPYCSIECSKKEHGDKVRGNPCNRKLTYEYVKNFIENIGYKLLSKEYKRAFSKLEIECHKGHKFKMAYADLQRNHRCPECQHPSKKFTYEYVKDYIENEGYELLSKEYKNHKIKLEMKCNKGHIFKLNFGVFKNIGTRCLECAGNKKLTYDFIKEQIEKEGYKLLSTKYKNARTKLEIECDKEHIYEVTYGHFKSGKRCPKCSNNVSKAEKEIFNYIKENIDCEVIENDRKQIINPKTNHPLEFDIWIPSLKKAIEFNGKYWHSSDYARERDRIKKEQCIKKSIDLLVIKESKWTKNKEACLEKIKEFIGDK